MYVEWGTDLGSAQPRNFREGADHESEDEDDIQDEWQYDGQSELCSDSDQSYSGLLDIGN